jgi:hypothetical protein
MSRQSVAQSVMNLFGCCASHDDSQCNVNCLHGSKDDSCPGNVCQRIVCCKNCPYYDYTKQTVEAHYRERKFVGESFGGGLPGYHGWGIDISNNQGVEQNH